jgi:hypothetical protein
MNDFTKEELEELHEHLTFSCEQYQEPESVYKLRDKLRKLIERYCEHKIAINYVGYVTICDTCAKPLLYQVTDNIRPCK